ncbi:LIM domain-binding protein 3 isoform X2 [Lingula anatina]|uniref:LIM domain-binding protein 3 isoform X2 n=1 Tax=Lingula anatina TaxID=7574 RepID=A0A1S3I1Y6_LINAN|nr:LIM domain-binding protein 3 isoform X2 [Lingula anatina]|eukprot:XP_013392280.1 LIM domain-binding protein 3 isoform X2 [Lingula anatina]
MTTTVGPFAMFQVTLHRDSLNTAWGFRLQGGKDFGKPLTIQRVFTGSPAEGELQRGDLIVAIDGYDTSNLVHKQAQDLIKRSGGTLSITVQRGESGRTPPQSPIKQPNILFQQPRAPSHTPVSPTHPGTMQGIPAPTPPTPEAGMFAVRIPTFKTSPRAPQMGTDFKGPSSLRDAPGVMMQRVAESLDKSLYSPPPAPMPQPRYHKFRPAPAAPVSPPPFINPAVYYPPQPQQHHPQQQQRSLQQMQPQFESMHVSAPEHHAPPPFAGGPPPEDEIDYSFMQMPVSARKQAFMHKEQAAHPYQGYNDDVDYSFMEKPVALRKKAFMKESPRSTQPRRTGRRPVIRTDKSASDFTGWSPGHDANKPSPRRQYEPAYQYEPPVNRKPPPPPVPAKPQHHAPAPAPAAEEYEEGSYAPAWRGTLKSGASVGRPWEVKQPAGGAAHASPGAPQYKAVSFSPSQPAVSQPFSPGHHAGPPAGGASGTRVETVQGHKQGPTAAHLQFNSPMKLYSTDNVRQSMEGQLRGTGAEGTMQVAGSASHEPDYTQSAVYRMVHEEPGKQTTMDVKQSRSFQTLTHVVSDDGGVDAVSDF